MKFSIITLFPELFTPFITHSIIKKAVSNNIVEIEIVNLRDFGTGKHKKVDDYPCGGGPGMVLTVPVLHQALNTVKNVTSKTILLSPRGRLWNNQQAYKFSKNSQCHIILIVGNYEGFDDRIRKYVDYEISLGDYILTGGEIPAMAIIDSIIRLLPGVINTQSHLHDSFNNGLLDYPSFTRPIIFDQQKVPAVLLSGHHQKIEKWRQEQSIRLTKKNRPDLFKKYIKIKK